MGWERARLTALFWTGLTLLVCLGLTALSAWEVQRRNAQVARDAVAVAAEEMADLVLSRISLYQYGLRGTRGAVLMAGEHHISHTQYRLYSQSRDLEREFPGARGFGFIRRVAAADEVAFQQAARADGWPAFTVRQLKPHAGERFVIQYVEPIGPNSQSVGLDIASEQNRRIAALASMRSGSPHLTGPITLVQAAGSPFQAFLMLMPIYRGGATPSTVEAREQALLGWSFAPLVMGDVLAGLGLSQMGAHLTLTDITEPDHQDIFFHNADVEQDLSRSMMHSLQRDVFGRRWQFEFSAQPTFVKNLNLLSPVWVATLGSFVSLLVAALAGMMRANLERRRQVFAEQARLAAIVSGSGDAIVGKTLDDRVIAWNPAAERMFGYSVDVARGQTLDTLVVPPERHSEEEGLLKRVSRGETITHYFSQLRHRDGHLLDVSVTMSPIRDSRGQVIGASETVRDISAQKAAERRIHELNVNLESQVAQRTAELTRVNRLIASVLSAATEVAIIATDADGTIRLFNRGAERMFGFLAEDMVGQANLLELYVRAEIDARGRELSDQLGGSIGGIRVLAELPATQAAETREWTLVRKDGSRFPATVVMTSMRDDSGQAGGLLAVVLDITQQKLAERERATSLATTQAILDTAPNPIITIDRNAIILATNPAVTKVFGYRQDELLGQHVRMLIPTSRLSVHDSGFAQAMRSDRPVSISRDVTARRKNGEVFPIHLTVGEMTVQGERRFVGVIIDISQQQRQRAELLAARDQLEMAAAVAGLGIWTWLPQKNLLQWNRRMLEIYGFPPELADQDLPFDHWRERIHPDDVEATLTVLQAALDGQAPFEPVFRVLLPDGRVRFIQAGAHVERDADNKPVRVTGINLDITDQQELEARLKQSKVQADAANAAKSSFLANMSHEIRTPLNAVLGLLQLVRQTELTVRQQDYIEKSLSSAKSLLNLLNDILDYSKIEAGKLEFDERPFELEALMSDLAVVLAGNQGQKNVEIVFDMDPSLPSVLVGDAFRLKQVLINLAGNAFKFTEQGQVVVSLEERERRADSVVLRFQVSDTGIGISPEQLDHIFDGFTQAEASTARRFGGSGLGLSISRRLVELMGGELLVASELGRGSQFWFDLALRIGKTVPIRASCPAADVPLHVLIADDNPVALELLVRAAESLGWRVEQATNGRDAVMLMQEAVDRNEKFDVVLLDWRMPDMNGEITAQRIQQINGSRPMPSIILITAHGREVLARSQQNASPFFDVLTKPVTPRQLSETVVRTLAGAATSATVKPQKVAAVYRLAGMRVLVVEDNAINRQVVAELLEQEGAQVELATGGQEGVDRVAAGPQDFDVVIMDMQMPDVDGLEATRRIRADIRCRRLPILAMTANASREDREACLAAGMNEHLGKPIDLELLVAKLLELTDAAAGSGTSAGAASSAAIEPLPSLLARFGGNRDLLRKLLVRFEPEQSKLLDELSQCLARADSTGAAAALHAIKGSAGTLGALSLAQRAAEVELECKAGRLDRLDAGLLADLRQRMKTCLAQLESVLAGADAPLAAPVSSGTTPVDWRASLTELLTLLEGGNLRALELADTLQWPVTTDNALQSSLNEQIQSLAFEQAAATVRTLLETT